MQTLHDVFLQRAGLPTPRTLSPSLSQVRSAWQQRPLWQQARRGSGLTSLNPTPPSARGSRHVCSGQNFVKFSHRLHPPSPDWEFTDWCVCVCSQEAASHPGWVHDQSGPAGHCAVHLPFQTQPCVQGVWRGATRERGGFRQHVPYTEGFQRVKSCSSPVLSSSQSAVGVRSKSERHLLPSGFERFCCNVL